MIWKYIFTPFAVSYHGKLLSVDPQKLMSWEKKAIPWLAKLITEVYAESRKTEDQFRKQWQLRSFVNNLEEAQQFLSLLSEVTGYSPIKKVVREEKEIASWYAPFQDHIGLAQFSIITMVHEYVHHITYRNLHGKELFKFWYHNFRYGNDHAEIFLKKEKEIFELLLHLQEMMLQNIAFTYMKHNHTAISLLKNAKLTNQIKKHWTIK